MNKYLFQYVLKYNPFVKEEDVEDITCINEWDILIKFKNGKKIIYDTFTNYYTEIFYNSINDITEEQEKKEFSHKLRSLMNRKNITQDELAEKTNTSQVMISRYITGRCIPSVIVLRKIAKVLNCSMDDFFYKEY